jgi:hypothetical protein
MRDLQLRATALVAVLAWIGTLAATVEGFAPGMHVLLRRRGGVLGGVQRRHCLRKTAVMQESGGNGVDAAYPYLFDGRLWFRPVLYCLFYYCVYMYIRAYIHKRTGIVDWI